MIHRPVASCLSFKTKLHTRVAVESSLSIRDETSDSVRISQVSVLLFVLSYEVCSIVTTLRLLFEREIICSHLQFQSVVSDTRIIEIVVLLRALEGLRCLRSLLRLVRSKVEVRFLEHGGLGVNSSSIVTIDHSISGTCVNVTSISSLSGVHVSLVLSQTELSRLHFCFKLSSIGCVVTVLDSVSLMGSIGVSLEVRLVISQCEVTLSQLLSHKLGLVRNRVAVGGGNGTNSLTLSVNVR